MARAHPSQHRSPLRRGNPNGQTRHVVAAPRPAHRPGFSGPKPGIQIGTYVAHNATDEDLQFLQQLDIPWAMVKVGDPAAHTAEGYRRIQERLIPYGLQICRVANHSVHNVEEITLNLPGRDEKIEEFLTFIRNLGAAGIHYNTYAHRGNGIWSTGRTAGRGGVL